MLSARISLLSWQSNLIWHFTTLVFLAASTIPLVDEKEALLPTSQPIISTQSWRSIIMRSLGMAVILVPLCVNSYSYYDWYIGNRAATPVCPQVGELTPVANGALWEAVDEKIGSPEFKTRAVDWLAGAVRIPTECYDDMPPVGQDPRWEAFGPFHDYLAAAFPLLHSVLRLTKVNTYGLYYEWKGSDLSLKPLLLAVHQDVVPVDATTVDNWIHPPYSGYFNGWRIWGRGSSDDKNGLIGILSAIETLAGAKFKPARTVVLSFGFDEEASGTQGTGQLASRLESVYGKNGIAMIVDEGSGFMEQYGSVLASPGIVEKGYMNFLLKSPLPVSIGILLALLVHFEQNPFKVKIERKEPTYHTLQCIAQHGKDVPEELRSVIQNSAHSNAALRKLQKIVRKDKLLSSLVGTTQAIDFIRGGVKSNALPEQAWAVVNHRIAVVSSVAEVQAHDTALLRGLTKKFDLTYNAFGSQISEEGAPSSGTLTISEAFQSSLELSPITPTGEDAAPYHILSRTIKATFNTHRSFSIVGSDSVIVVPSMMTGNTDTCFYWGLSPHIFRYNHQNDGKGSEFHTVNEFIEIYTFWGCFVSSPHSS